MKTASMKIRRPSVRTSDRMFNWCQDNLDELLHLYEVLFIVVEDKNVLAAFRYRCDAYSYAALKCRKGCFCIFHCTEQVFREVRINKDAITPPPVIEASLFGSEQDRLREWMDRNIDILMPQYSGLYMVVADNRVWRAFDDESDAEEFALAKFAAGSFIVSLCTDNATGYGGS